MSMSATRIGAVVRKELAEFRRNRLIVTTAAILPVVFLASPTVSILTLKASALSTVLEKRVDAALFLPLLIPVFVPALMSAYSVVGEREQETLEPVLTTPVSRVEFLLGKAAAIFVPAIGVSYLMFGVFVAITQFAATSAVATAVLHAPQLPAELVFTVAGSIARQQTVELPVEPGHHTLLVRSSPRFGSRERSFEAADGQDIGFWCHSQRWWPMYLAASIKPDLWISLRQE